MALKKRLVLGLIAAGFLSLTARGDDYTAQIRQWHKGRIERLTQPDSWLSLAGLFWLHEGENSFGSDAANDIRFPKKAPAFIGVFVLRDSAVSVRVNDGVTVTHEGEPVKELALKSDISGEPTILRHGALLWYIIDRDGKMGVRLKDTESENIAAFQGIELFRIDPAWRFEARLDTLNAPKTLNIPTVLGTVSKESCPGALVFEYRGAQYRLYPVGEAGDDNYFLIFADETNGDETYGAGRFLVVPAADENGRTVVDFNKAYNPPCAFTPYATCPLPPRGNRLPFKVTAGEKAYAGGHH